MGDPLNIKNLPHVDDIQPGDFLLVEVPTGSRIIDFKNFVIGKNNISFSGELSAFNENITALLSRTDTLTSALFYGDQDLIVNSLSAKTYLSAGQGITLNAYRITKNNDTDTLDLHGHLSAMGLIYSSAGYVSDQWDSTWIIVNANSGHWNQAYTETTTYRS